jgi:hypothetical protein
LFAEQNQGVEKKAANVITLRGHDQSELCRDPSLDRDATTESPCCEGKWSLRLQDSYKPYEYNVRAERTVSEYSQFGGTHNTARL